MSKQQQVNPEDVDLEKTMAPPGLTVEIEGFEKTWQIDVVPMNLVGAIGHAYCVLTGKPVGVDADFARRVKLLEINIQPPKVKVAVSES